MRKDLTLKMNSSELKGLMDALEMIGKTHQEAIERVNNNAAEIAKSILNTSMSEMIDYGKMQRDISKSIVDEFLTIASSSLSSAQAMKAIADTLSVVAIAQSTVSSDMIDGLAYSFASADFHECQNIIQNVVCSSAISMADYSFLKTTR